MTKGFVGQSVPRVDGEAKVRGTAVYVDDMVVPGALFGGTVSLYIACSEQVGCSPVGPVLVGGLLGGAATGGLGALIGLVIRSDRWQALPLGEAAMGRKATVGIGLSPVPGRGFQVGVSVGF